MNHPSDTPRPADAAAGTPAEVLSQSERTRVWRERSPNGGSRICKQALGPDASRRTRLERAALERLAGLEGVPRLSGEPAPDDDVLVLEDDDAVPLPLWLRSHPLPLGELLGLALQLARVLAGVHGRGVVHKDINPANIVVVGSAHRPVLIDFDLASSAAEEQPGFTHPSEIVGSLAYMSPEQTGRTGRAVDHRADLYSLGVTLYELATGRCPFIDQDPLALIHAHLARVPLPPTALKPGLPAALSDIILRLLEKDADRRYQSAEGLAHDLTQLIERISQGPEQGKGVSLRLGERDFPMRLAPPSRAVGREVEIATLQSTFEAAASGRGQVLLVGGPAGVGKTALVNELRAMVTARRGWFVTGRVEPYRPDAAIGPAVQAMRALGTLLLAEPEDQLSALRERMRSAVGVNAGVTATVVPELALLLGITPDVAAAGDLEQATQRLRQGMLDMLRAVASVNRPLVLVIDNLQWCAPRTLAFFDAVMSEGDLPGVLLVGTYRDNEVDTNSALTLALGRWAARREAPVRIILRNLGLAELDTLLQRMLRLAPDQAAALAEVVAVSTGGNPFDTVELVNALRRDGLLVPQGDGWHWQADAVRHYVGRGDVVDRLGARIERLPGTARELLESLACLGSEVQLRLLRVACGLSAATLEARLAPALEDGLLILEGGASAVAPGRVRFRHDRVQQAAYARLGDDERRALHLRMARRLAASTEFAAMAAEQYLPAIGLINSGEGDGEGEPRRVLTLLRAAAEPALLTNQAVAERLLSAALDLLAGIATPQDAALQCELQVQRITALYALSRHEELDAAYRALEAQGHAPQLLAEAACVRIESLVNRGRHADALALGLALLRRLGLPIVGEGEGNDDASWALFEQRTQALDIEADIRRLAAKDPVVLAMAELLERLLVPAYFLGAKVAARLLFAGQALWAQHGPCPRLLLLMGGAVGPLVAVRQDYALAYRLLRHTLTVGEARGWEPETASIRHYFAVLGMHWREPLEKCLPEAERSREGMLKWGLVQQASYTYAASMIPQLECGARLETLQDMYDTFAAYAARMGNAQAAATLPTYRQLLRALRGETSAPGSLVDAQFDEDAYLGGLGMGRIPGGAYRVYAALAAVIFGDRQALLRHSEQALAHCATQPNYRAAQAYVLRCVAAAWQLAEAPDPALAAEFDACRAWLAARAADAPFNFSHLLAWVDAERACSLGDHDAAAAGYLRALRLVEPLPRPWHLALISERAGLYFLAQGPQHLGRELIARACQGYGDWGASGKVRQMLHEHAFLSAERRKGQGVRLASLTSSGGVVSSQALDMVAVLRASQALSSETSLARLKLRVAELLGALTGASSVLLVLRGEDQRGWFVSEASDDPASAISVEDAAARRLLPTSALHYALRTREPLVVADAVLDDRFARDPYLAGREHCSLLVVPILRQGEPHAVLILENRLARGAFSPDRLDAVTLIAGQLAVSLDNAQLYASLERKVSQRTADLQELVSGLESFNRSVSHDLRGPLGGISGLATMAAHALERNDDSVARRVLPVIAQQAEASTRLVSTLLTLARVGDASIHQQRVEIGALTQEVFNQLAQADPAQPLPAITIKPVPPVYADVDLLRPVMVNLLSNAIKFVRGRPAPHIEVAGIADERGEVTISVCDNGVGFESDAARKLFQPFTRLHGRAFEGHGVGLSIVRRAVERHGGRVWASSKPGEGACFYFTLPSNAPSPDAPARAG